jgi:hypothetical protein
MELVVFGSIRPREAQTNDSTMKSFVVFDVT